MAKILLVDDSKDLVFLLAFILKKKGFQVEGAYSKKELLYKLSLSIPDILLLNTIINSDEGRELCKELKKHPDYNHISIILISSNPNKLKGYDECLADDVIVKPFDCDILIDKINTQLNKKL
jgi:DNA-binding response OmpR family regulator